MHGCQRPLKLTDFVAHPGLLVSIASVQPGIFLELLGLIKNVSVEAEQAVFVAPNEEILEAAHLYVSHSHLQSQRSSVAQLCKGLASFAKARLGIDPRHSSTAIPFFWRVNAPLQGWLGDSGQEKSDTVTTLAAAPAQKTAQQVESLRKALQLRKSATDRVATGGPRQPVLFSQPVQHQLSQLQPGQAVVGQPNPQLSSEIKNAPVLADTLETSAAVAKLARADHVEVRVVPPKANANTGVEWMRDEDAPRCCECNAAFTLLNRRHHCRACGRIVDKRCCSNFYMDRSMQLVCLPCQGDIEHGQTPEQAAQNRAQARSRVSNAREQQAAASQYGFSLDTRGPVHSTDEHEHVRKEDSETPNFHHNAASSAASNRRTRDRRVAVTAPAPLVASPAMQLSDLHGNEREYLPSAAVQRDMYAPLMHSTAQITRPLDSPHVHSPHLPSSIKRQRLPSRAFGGNSQPDAIHRTSRDPFEAAYDLLDRVYQDCSNPDLMTLAVGQLEFHTFVQWAETTLEMPSEAAGAAAAAAYRLTQNLVSSSLQQEVEMVAKTPGIAVPRSLFPMLLLNLKLELQKQEISFHASSRLVKGNLPSRIQGRFPTGAAASALELQSLDPWSYSMGKNSSQKGSRAEATAQFDAAVREIESILQSSGFGSEEYTKVAADLVNAGACDKRTLVRLLQQDNSVLSMAGLQPCHVLRVLRHMVKQPAFAAEAPSFRLNLDDD